MKAPVAYRMHDVFVAPAKAYPHLWRFAAGIGLVGFAYVGLVQLYLSVIYALAPSDAGGLVTDMQNGATPLGMYLLLFSFAFMSVAAWMSARVLQKRGFVSLLGPPELFRQDFRMVSLAMIAITVLVFVLPPWGMGAPLVQNLALGPWIMLLVPSLAFVLIQTSAEEILFRGYIQQQLAARFKSPLVWMVLPAVLFALGHYLPDTAGDNALVIAVWAGLFGILMADLTARSGSLGPAIAVHFFNNVSAILIVSLPGDLSGLALYLTPFDMNDTEALRAWLPVDFALMIVLWLAARVAIRR